MQSSLPHAAMSHRGFSAPSLSSIYPSLPPSLCQGSTIWLSAMAHLAQPGANLYPWLPGREKESERRKSRSGKERQIKKVEKESSLARKDRKRVSQETKKKKLNQAYLIVPSSEGHALVMGRTNSQCVCVCLSSLCLVIRAE